MERLMILGATASQLPLYEAAKRLGMTTIAASIPGDYPGFSASDEQAYVNIADPEEVVKAAEEFHITGAATCSIDLCMPAIGAVNDHLHLNGPSYRSAVLASDKYEMKKALWEHGVSTARFVCIEKKEDIEKALQELQFPLVVKAVDQSGSRGIFRSNTPEEVYANYEKAMEATRKPYCLIEEFIEGYTFGVEGMIQNGKILFLMADNTINAFSAVPTPIGHSIPLKDSDILLPKIQKEVAKALEATGLDNCPFNFDFIRRGDDIFVIELAGRSGANGLSELVSYLYDIDYYEAIASIAAGRDVSEYFRRKNDKAFVYQKIITLEHGTLQEISDRNENDPDLIFRTITGKAGDEVHGYTNGRDGLGYLMMRGNTLEEAEENCRRYLDNIVIRTK